MKLRTLLRILHPEIVVRLMDDDRLELLAKVKDIPKELKERKVETLHRSWSDSEYDLYIKLKV